MRLHGKGRAVLTDDPVFADLAGRFPGGAGVGVRSIIVAEVSRVADSCGYGVPFMSFEGHLTNDGPMVEQEGAGRNPQLLGGEEHQEHRSARRAVDRRTGLIIRPT